MSPTLRALLTRLIDYAGLFPPARLPLDQALRNYADYRQSADNWMLGRFIIPAIRLQELASFDSLMRLRTSRVFETTHDHLWGRRNLLRGGCGHGRSFACDCNLFRGRSDSI